MAGISLLVLVLLNPTAESGRVVPLPVVEDRATVLFAGDAFFDRSIRVVMEEKGGNFILSCIADVLKAADIVVANLEGPVTDNPSVSVGSAVGSPNNFRFTFPPETAQLLFDHNIRIVNLGNNHITNFGMNGVEQTLEYLEGVGVAYFGEPPTYSAARTVLNGIPIAFVGYNEFGGEASTTIARIREVAGEGYLPVVHAHWGAEYEKQSSLYIQQLAREFVDAGARLVIGAHPHVVQQSELYNGVYIYYSLGNFIFDQYFNEDVRKGLMVEVEFTREGVTTVREIPTYLERDRRTCLLL